MLAACLRAQASQTPGDEKRRLLDSLTIIQDNIQYNGESWTAYEDLSRIDGGLFFQSTSGQTRNLTAYLEQSFDPPPGTGSVEFFLGLNQTEVNLALPDLLADALLMNGEPIEAHVRDAVPLLVQFGSVLGNVYANDTMFIDSYGTTSGQSIEYSIDLPMDFSYNFSYDGLVYVHLLFSLRVFVSMILHRFGAALNEEILALMEQNLPFSTLPSLPPSPPPSKKSRS